MESDRLCAWGELGVTLTSSVSGSQSRLRGIHARAFHACTICSIVWGKETVMSQPG